MSDKVAIVTAASKGMGAATARELRRRGYAVCISSTSAACEKLAQEIGAVAVRGSITEPKESPVKMAEGAVVQGFEAVWQ